MPPLVLDMGVVIHADKCKNAVVTNSSVVTTHQQFYKKGKCAQSLHCVETLCACNFVVCVTEVLFGLKVVVVNAIY